jgi:Fe-S oxidoreductase
MYWQKTGSMWWCQKPSIAAGHLFSFMGTEMTGAEAVVTGCGSCRMQLEDGLYQEKMNLPVYHTVEILNMAYK